MLRKKLEETIRRFLTEVNVKQLKQQYPGFEDVIDELTTKVENKYLEFIMKIYSKRKYKLILEQLIELCNLYEKFSKSKKIDAFIKDENIENLGNQMNIDILQNNPWMKSSDVKDINFFYRKAEKEKMDPLTVLKSFLDILRHYKTRSEEEREVKQATKKIYEDSSVLILSPQSREASCFYGKGTKWCISAKNGNMWDSYTDNDIFFAFIFDKNPKEENGRKIAIAFYPYPNTAMEIYDATDRQLKFQDLLNYYGNKKLQLILGKIRKNFIGNRQYNFFFFLAGDIIEYSEKYLNNLERDIEKDVDRDFRILVKGKKVDKEAEDVIKNDLVRPKYYEEKFKDLGFSVGDIVKPTEWYAGKLSREKGESEEVFKKVLQRRYKVVKISENKDASNKDSILLKNISSGKEIWIDGYAERNFYEISFKDQEDVVGLIKNKLANKKASVFSIDQESFVAQGLGRFLWKDWKKFKLVGHKELETEYYDQ